MGEKRVKKPVKTIYDFISAKDQFKNYVGKKEWSGCPKTVLIGVGKG